MLDFVAVRFAFSVTAACQASNEKHISNFQPTEKQTQSFYATKSPIPLNTLTISM